MLVLESINQQLDDLLERIGEKLQLSPTRYQQAESRYHAVGDWLSAEDSTLATFDPVIYPQGSMKIGTTVRPRGRQAHDLDFVLELKADWRLFPRPVVLLDMVEHRLREHKIYREMIERKNRCMRIIYANEFHLDILPACPNPSAGLHCVLVPDCAAEGWKHSNPKGYALWFERTAETKRAEFRKQIEPL
ncbi:MAG: nucleotidyltransferase, partial [Pyrinomonadaceae bacterium]